ncbi:hypothetical protein ACFT7S_29855 [Streptomyces sp. NPDC057136]
MLATPRGRSNGIAFALGWTVSLAVLVTVIQHLPDGITHRITHRPASPAR